MIIQMLNSHITWDLGNSTYTASKATMKVPGLGTIEIEDFLSEDLRERLAKEAIFSLQRKLGIKDEELIYENP